jgi:hypothetical protein
MLGCAPNTARGIRNVVESEIMGGNCNLAAIIKRDPEGGYLRGLASIVDWKPKFGAFFRIADKDFCFATHSCIPSETPSSDIAFRCRSVTFSSKSKQILSKRMHLPRIVAQLYPLKLRIADDRVVRLNRTKFCPEINILLELSFLESFLQMHNSYAMAILKFTLRYYVHVPFSGIPQVFSTLE